MSAEQPPGAGGRAAGGGPPPEYDEESLRAAYEAELKRVKVSDVLVQTVVSLLNLGGRRAGLAPGTEDERDLEQVRVAVDAVRALIPVLEQGRHKDELGPIRNALSQLQMAYAREAQAQPTAPGEAASKPGDEGSKPAEGEGPGPAQSSGRLWIPGQ